MSTEHLDISKALEDLLVLSEPDRHKELEDLAKGDPELAAELHSLVAAHLAGPDFLRQFNVHGAVELLLDSVLCCDSRKRL